jgi:hypothetical protein
METFIAQKYQLDQERAVAIRPYEEKVKKLAKELAIAQDELLCVEVKYGRRADPINTNIKHQAQYDEIKQEIQGFANLQDPDTPQGRWKDIPAVHWFMGSRYNGYALYADGVFEVYSNAGGPGDTHVPRYRKVPMVCKFDYYEAYTIAKDASIPHAERVRQLYALLDAFRVPV